MPFASTALAERIERAEARLMAEAAAAAARRHAGELAFARALGGGFATCAEPGSPLNKVAGLGFAALDEDELREVERAFDARGVPVQVELSTVGEPEVARRLTRRGYVLVGFEDVLGRDLPGPAFPPIAEGIEVDQSPPDELELWTELVVDAFAVPDEQGVASHESFPRAELERSIADLCAVEGLVRWMARRAGEPAGGASMRLAQGVAQLCGAATSPAHRRRGVQSALLATRLAAAAGAGCDVAVTTTQPGSKSQENARRQGFELLYARAILIRGA